MDYKMQSLLSLDHKFGGVTQNNWGFTLDESNQEISSSAGSMRLRTKLWQVLLLLVQRTNHLITRDTLIEEVWDGNFLTGPQGITHTVCHLRQVVKKLELPLEIITLPKQGYVIRTTSKELNKEHNKEHRQSVDGVLPVIAKSDFIPVMTKTTSSASVPFALAE